MTAPAVDHRTARANKRWTKHIEEFEFTATAARALGISRQSLYALIRADKAPIEVLDVGGYSFRSADLRRYLLGDQPPAVDLAAKVDELLAAHLESVRLLGILVAATTTTQIGRAS